MRVKLIRHGHSVGVTLPASVVTSLNLTPGTPYELEASPDGQLHLRPIQRRRSRFSAEELLEGMPETPLRYDDLPQDTELTPGEQAWLE